MLSFNDNSDKQNKKISTGNKFELPKGGGAIKGLEENLSVNQSTGTLNLSIKLPFMENRHGFNPPVSLNYNSASGNGILGMGWDLSFPAIFRKTERKIPQYQDDIESDTFILSGCDDLIPYMEKDKDGSWHNIILTSDTLKIKRYRPRIEKDFFKIEKIQDNLTTCWKVTTGDNKVTFYGLTDDGRIKDPDDSSRVWKWLPQLTYDNLGNLIQYKYKKEDKLNVPDRLNEKTRRGIQSNVYLKSILYSNETPFFQNSADVYAPIIPSEMQYYFEVVLDYGEQDVTDPYKVKNEGWQVRKDAFSTFKPGFELRTWRLLNRILFFNRFKELSYGETIEPVLVKSVDFSYKHFGSTDSKGICQADYITEITHSSYKKLQDGSYVEKSLPPLKLDYTETELEMSKIKSGKLVLENMSLDENYSFIDYYNEGIPGILFERSEGLYYSENLGEASFKQPEKLMSIPSARGLKDGKLEIGTLDPAGKKFLISMEKESPGFYEQDSKGSLIGFTMFKEIPNINKNHKNSCYIDLNGDGLGELVVFEDGKLIFYPSTGRTGLGHGLTFTLPFEEEGEPKLLWSTDNTGLFLADMNGDGLTDIVLVTNREVSYWPNMGYGKFGERVHMENCPVFDSNDGFNPAKLIFPDITGTGTADIVYTGESTVKVYLNSCGNSFFHCFDTGFNLDGGTSRRWSFSDLFGCGINVLLCRSISNSTLDGFVYIDLLDRMKPYLLKTVDNQCGRKSEISYRSSSSYYLSDKKNNIKWASKLPFPIHCVEKITSKELSTGLTMIKSYKYRHGFYNGYEHEFMGFGLVESLDSEIFSSDASQPPVLTKTWYHIGSTEDWPEILYQFKKEFFSSTTGFNENFDYGIELKCKDQSLNNSGLKDDFRALKFTMVRKETYGLDGTPNAAIPYETTAVKMLLKEVQPMGHNSYNSVLALEGKSSLFIYERNDEKPRITEILNLLFDDDTGMILENAVSSFGAPPNEGFPTDVVFQQQKKHTLYTVYSYTDKLDTVHYRLPQMYEKVTYEIFHPSIQGTLNQFEMKALFTSCPEVNWGTDAKYLSAFKKKTSTERILYYSEDLQSPLILGTQSSRAFVYRKYSLVMDSNFINNIYKGEVGSSDMEAIGYASTGKLINDGLFKGSEDDGWWIGSEQLIYSTDPWTNFCMPVACSDFLGKTEKLEYYGGLNLFMSALEDPMGIKMEITSFDMRTLSPKRLIDRNKNISERVFDVLGEVSALVLMGKGLEADSLSGVKEDISQSDTSIFFSNPSANAAVILGNATERYVYDYSSIPLRTAKLSRDIHKSMENPGHEARIFIEINYIDGFGNIISSKKLYEPGKAKAIDADGNMILVDTGTASRWIASGRSILNNKGKPHQVYEPYFSNTHNFDSEAVLYTSGIFTKHMYDPLGRIVKTLFPDGTYEKTKIDSWKVSLYDRNDNVADSDWFKKRQTGAFASDAYEKASADKTLLHADTPLIQYLDNRGKPVLIRTIVKTPGKPEQGLTETQEISDTVIKTDILGNKVTVVSPRGFVEENTCFDMIGQVVWNLTADTGMKFMLYDGVQRVCMTWDQRNEKTKLSYDALNRVTALSVSEKGGTEWHLSEKTEYGESIPDAHLKNQLGQAVRHYDQAGIINNKLFDFKGNILEYSRCLFENCELKPDWDMPPSLSSEEFTFKKTYNAFNMPLLEILPDGSMQQYEYDLGSFIKNISGNVKSSGQKEFIHSIVYDEKGQRTFVKYSNGAQTAYKYDTLTFRLVNITSSRPESTSPKVYQSLIYTYDPVGNVSSVKDQAGETVFFDGGSASTENNYLYDSSYRLVKAEGREHDGQNKPYDSDDFIRTFANHPNDGSSLRRYKEYYIYDLDGNINEIKHFAGSSTLSWTRTMNFQPNSNHLVSETTGSQTNDYGYDQAGNMNKMPPIECLQWNFKGMLIYSQNSSKQYTKYSYDSSGQRVRKVTQYPNGIVKERIYLGSIEIYREYSGAVKICERQTLSFNDESKVFLEIDVDISGLTASKALSRFRLDNYLNSNMMELDSEGRIISYEEYYPFGGTSFKATRSWGIEVPMSRYRYLGKERDEETGLYYFGLRFYAPWLGKWISADPKACKESHGLYVFLNNNPLRYSDPTGGEDEDKVDGNDEKSKEKDSNSKLNNAESKNEKEKPSIMGVILGSIKVLKSAALMVLGIINGDNWLKILQKIGGLVKDVWDFLGYLSDEITKFQKSAVDSVIDFAKNKILQPVASFFKGLWQKIVKFFSSSKSEDKKNTEIEVNKANEDKKKEESNIGFDASANTSGLSLTLKIGTSELSLSIGDGLNLKGNVNEYTVEVGTSFKFDELRYKYGGKFAEKDGVIKFSLDQYERKNSAIFKTPFFWLNYYRNKSVYQTYNF